MFEKVNPCHPDKLADRIAGALVDMAYAKETDPRIAVEVLIGHGVYKKSPREVSRVSSLCSSPIIMIPHFLTDFN